MMTNQISQINTIFSEQIIFDSEQISVIFDIDDHYSKDGDYSLSISKHTPAHPMNAPVWKLYLENPKLIQLEKNRQYQLNFKLLSLPKNSIINIPLIIKYSRKSISINLSIKFVNPFFVLDNNQIRSCKGITRLKNFTENMNAIYFFDPLEKEKIFILIGKPGSGKTSFFIQSRELFYEQSIKPMLLPDQINTSEIPIILIAMLQLEANMSTTKFIYQIDKAISNALKVFYNETFNNITGGEIDSKGIHQELNCPLLLEVGSMFMHDSDSVGEIEAEYSVAWELYHSKFLKLLSQDINKIVNKIFSKKLVIIFDEIDKDNFIIPEQLGWLLGYRGRLKDTDFLSDFDIKICFGVRYHPKNLIYIKDTDLFTGEKIWSVIERIYKLESIPLLEQKILNERDVLYFFNDRIPDLWKDWWKDPDIKEILLNITGGNYYAVQSVLFEWWEKLNCKVDEMGTEAFVKNETRKKKNIFLEILKNIRDKCSRESREVIPSNLNFTTKDFQGQPPDIFNLWNFYSPYLNLLGDNKNQGLELLMAIAEGQYNFFIDIEDFGKIFGISRANLPEEVNLRIEDEVITFLLTIGLIIVHDGSYKLAIPLLALVIYHPNSKTKSTKG